MAPTNSSAPPACDLILVLVGIISRGEEYNWKKVGVEKFSFFRLGREEKREEKRKRGIEQHRRNVRWETNEGKTEGRGYSWRTMDDMVYGYMEAVKQFPISLPRPRLTIPLSIDFAPTKLLFQPMFWQPLGSACYFYDPSQMDFPWSIPWFREIYPNLIFAFLFRD